MRSVHWSCVGNHEWKLSVTAWSTGAGDFEASLFEVLHAESVSAPTTANAIAVDALRDLR